MRRIVTSLILSLILASGTGAAFAGQRDGHGNRHHMEQRDNGRHHNNSKPRPGDSHKHKHKNKHDKDWHKKDHRPHPGNNKHYNHPPKPKKHHNFPSRYHHRPTPPPPRHHYAPGPPPPPPANLGHMVGYLTRGCRDVAVWQIDYDTYIVKYRRGNRFYTQRFYPYLGEYGSRNQISVNWQPMNPWTLIPSVHLNINI